MNMRKEGKGKSYDSLLGDGSLDDIDRLPEYIDLV